MSLYNDAREVFWHENFDDKLFGETVRFEVENRTKKDRDLFPNVPDYEHVRITAYVEGYYYRISCSVDSIFAGKLSIPVLNYFRAIREYQLDCLKQYLSNVKEDDNG